MHHAVAIFLLTRNASTWRYSYPGDTANTVYVAGLAVRHSSLVSLCSSENGTRTGQLWLVCATEQHPAISCGAYRD
jgi:hypothetical protein